MVNNNYYKLMEEQSKLSDLRAEQKKAIVLEENLRKWKNRVGDELGSIKLAGLNQEFIEILSELKEKPINVIVASQDRKESLKAGYSIVNYCLSKGYFGPSEVRITSLSQAYNNIHGTFEAKEWKQNFFDKNAKMFVIHGCNKITAKLAKKGDLNFWTEFLDFIITDNQKNFILVYNLTAEETPEQDGRQYLSISHEREINLEILRNSKKITTHKNLLK